MQRCDIAMSAFSGIVVVLVLTALRVSGANDLRSLVFAQLEDEGTDSPSPPLLSSLASSQPSSTPLSELQSPPYQEPATPPAHQEPATPPAYQPAYQPASPPPYQPPYFSGDSANISLLLERLMRGYDKRLRPHYNGKPVEVGITMYVISISAISEVGMDFTLDFYFRQHWEDVRLQFSDTDEELCISNEMLDKVWWPDTFFANAKLARFHTATTKNAFIRINKDGFITLSLRLTVTAMCNMDLTFFPMDSQICSLEIESYAYSVKHIAYKWKSGADSVGVGKDLNQMQFILRGYRNIEKTEVLSTGNYSRLACEFYFVRSLGYYIMHIYLPSTLIVMLSWVSFWLARDSAPARVALGITTVLTMTTLMSSTNASLPKISYLKSTDVYLVTCFVMVFAAIVEYAVGARLASHRCPLHLSPPSPSSSPSPPSRQIHKSSLPQDSNSLDQVPSSHKLDVCGNGKEFTYIPSVKQYNANLKLAHTESMESSAPLVTPPDCRQCGDCSVKIYHAKAPLAAPASKPSKPPKSYCMILAENVDRYSRIAFPTIFLMFSAVYWMAYSNLKGKEPQGFVLMNYD